MEQTTERRQFLKTASLAGLAGTMVAAVSAQEVPAAGQVRILGISCSPRAGKTTAAALTLALESARSVQRDGIQTELIELAGLRIPVFDPGNDDKGDFPLVAAKLRDPMVAGIIVGTPVYFSGMSSLCKAFIDHLMAFRRDGFALRNRVAGALAVGGVRNGGQELALEGVQAGLMCQEMLVVGDGRPTAHTGATLWNKDDSILHDDFGVETARNLGRRVAEVALMLQRRA